MKLIAILLFITSGLLAMTIKCNQTDIIGSGINKSLTISPKINEIFETDHNNGDAINFFLDKDSVHGEADKEDCKFYHKNSRVEFFMQYSCKKLTNSRYRSIHGALVIDWRIRKAQYLYSFYENDSRRSPTRNSITLNSCELSK